MVFCSFLWLLPQEFLSLLRKTVAHFRATSLAVGLGVKASFVGQGVDWAASSVTCSVSLHVSTLCFCGCACKCVSGWRLMFTSPRHACVGQVSTGFGHTGEWRNFRCVPGWFASRILGSRSRDG